MSVLESKILRVLLPCWKMISCSHEWSVRRVQIGKSRPLERMQLANQVQGFKISDLSDASQKNIMYILSDILVCSVTVYFGKCCSILASPKAKSKH